MATPKDRANDTSRQLVRDDSKLMPPLATHEEEQIRNYRAGDGVFPKKVNFEADNPFHQKIVRDSEKGITTGFPLRNVPKAPSTRKKETGPRNRVYKGSFIETKEAPKAAPVTPATPQEEVKSLGVNIVAKSDRDRVIAEKQAKAKAAKQKAREESAATEAKRRKLLGLDD